ncbi:hypothetical protein [Niveibacterium sp. SC-1]|uniref:phosphotransferase-like protein n=1 Tax=Niveibacterium sp. SC-1 TaxID=3135646 RepID=UPI00311E4429
MARLVLLNGAVNAGKSTVARLLRERCQRLAHIEVDDLTDFADWMSLERKVPLGLVNACDVARNFLAEGVDVLLTYPLSDADFAFMRARLGAEIEPVGITLWCEPGRNRENRGTRVLSDWERERIGWMHANGVARPAFSLCIDTTRLTPEETAAAVITASGLSLKENGPDEPGRR